MKTRTQNRKGKPKMPNWDTMTEEERTAFLLYFFRNLKTIEEGMMK